MKYDNPIDEAMHILECCCSKDFMDQLKAALKARGISPDAKDAKPEFTRVDTSEWGECIPEGEVYEALQAKDARIAELEKALDEAHDASISDEEELLKAARLSEMNQGL